MYIVMLGLAWIVFGVAAFLFWRKLDNRIYNNELQQAHTDTFMGAVRREIAWMTPDAEWREWTMISELM